jgi:hypothetical protein
MARSFSNYYHWLTLYNFIYFLRAENYIEDVTFQEMKEHIIHLKGLALDQDDKDNEERERAEE